MKRLNEQERKSLFKVWDWVYDRHENVGWDNLSLPEQSFYAVWHLEAEVGHGGFQYYYFYSGGDHALDAPAALEAVGALKLKQIIEEANAVFPGARPARDIDDRQNFLDDELGDKQHEIWSSLDDEVYEHVDPTEELLWDYYQKHSGEFTKANKPLDLLRKILRRIFG